MKVADMHCDTIAELFYRKEKGQDYSILNNDCHIDLTRMKQGDYCLQNFALFTDLAKREKPFEYAVKLLDFFYEELSGYSSRIGIVTGYGDIEKNQREGKMSALLTIEEGGVCQGNLEFLRTFYRLGVRMMTLTWNHKNELGWPNRIRVEGEKAFFEPETGQGLTHLGISFVLEMERLGMIVDVSHLSDKGIQDVFCHTKKPFAASHSNARAKASNPRNLTDEMIRKLSERGGVMGINYCAAFLRDWKEGEAEVSRIEDMVSHIRHIRQVGGIACIGLGSDFDGIGGNLELKSPADLPLLEQALEKAGFCLEEIEAIFYKNVLRLYKEILK